MRKYTDEQLREKRREWGAKGGKKTAELGLSGFKTMSREKKVEAGKAGYKVTLAKKMKEGQEGGDQFL